MHKFKIFSTLDHSDPCCDTKTSKFFLHSFSWYNSEKVIRTLVDFMVTVEPSNWSLCSSRYSKTEFKIILSIIFLQIGSRDWSIVIYYLFSAFHMFDFLHVSRNILSFLQFLKMMGWGGGGGDLVIVKSHILSILVTMFAWALKASNDLLLLSNWSEENIICVI